MNEAKYYIKLRNIILKFHFIKETDMSFINEFPYVKIEA